MPPGRPLEWRARRRRPEHVLELGLVFLVFGGLAVASAVLVLVPPGVLMAVGVGLAALALLGGSAAGVVYHVMLHRHLAPRGALPRGWWLSPTRYHEQLTEAERPSVRRWFVAGAVGWVLTIVGSLLAAVGAIRGG